MREREGAGEEQRRVAILRRKMMRIARGLCGEPEVVVTEPALFRLSNGPHERGNNKTRLHRRLIHMKRVWASVFFLLSGDHQRKRNRRF